MSTIHDLPTPALLLDLDRLEASIAGMAERARRLDVRLRPHAKTHKCVEVARLQLQAGAAGLTVATVEEARLFARHGFTDLTWAFPVIPSRLAELAEISSGAEIQLVVDSREALAAVVATGLPYRLFLKVDCGYHRAGVDPAADASVELAREIADTPPLAFAGILSHSGHAYLGPGRREVLAAAEEERAVMATFAERLRREGIAVPCVSVGSTPAMAVVESLAGIDEARPGNYAFYDYTQCLLGSCSPAECALTVWSTVVSRPPGGDHGIVDAGALALSVDAGPDFADDVGMGRVFADYPGGELSAETYLTGLSQEHGKLRRPPALGTRVRILPNHSCLTAACFDHYEVVRGERVVGRWRIWRGR